MAQRKRKPMGYEISMTWGVTEEAKPDGTVSKWGTGGPTIHATSLRKVAPIIAKAMRERSYFTVKPVFGPFAAPCVGVA